MACPAMRFRKIPLEGCVRSWCRKITEFFGKVAPAKSKSNFGGPAGGEALERASPKKAMHYMTRRAFLSSKSNTAAREIEFQHASQKLV